MEIVALGTTIGVGIRAELVHHIKILCFFTSVLFIIRNMIAAHVLRFWLFVPGHDKRKIEHAASSAADGVILDWEDSVLPEDKPLARECSAQIRTLRSGRKARSRESQLVSQRVVR
jgi:hypothetical protein